MLLIVWECNFAQDFSVLISIEQFLKDLNEICLWPPTLSFLVFLVQKIIWWSDNPILISSYYATFPFVFVKMWSIRVDVLGVTLVGDFINCLRPKVLQNYRHFFVSDDTLFTPFIIFLFFSPNAEPLWYKFLLSKFRLFDSISRNIVWSGVHKQFQQFDKDIFYFIWNTIFSIVANLNSDVTDYTFTLSISITSNGRVSVNENFRISNWII